MPLARGLPPVGGKWDSHPSMGGAITWGGGGQVWRRSPLLFPPGIYVIDCTQFVDTNGYETLAYCVVRCTVPTIVESRACTKHSHAV